MKKDTKKILKDLLEEETNTCPCCQGKGKIPVEPSMEFKRYIAKEMRKHGFSIRAIMRIMEYKSTCSVTNLLKDKP